MKRYILILFVAVISFSSCSLESEEQISFSLVFLPIETAEVPTEFEFGETYSITIRYFLPSACYQFRDIYYDYDENSRIIAVNSILNNDEICTQALIEQEHTFSVLCSQQENYVFKFWQGENSQGEDQYLIVEVPVNN
jgi:hypothetical protein